MTKGASMADDIKFSVILGFMGQTRDRFQVFGPQRSLEETIARAAQVESIGALEVVYPGQLDDVPYIRRLMDDHGLACSTVNVNIKGDPVFHMGALTSPESAVRRQAVDYLKHGMDIAPEMGCNTVTCCPLGDGHEYAFQIDYVQAWGWFLEGIREAAAYRPDVRLSLEYKLNETRAHCIMGSAASALHICDQIGLPNLGVTIDIGHALYGLETPGLSIAQLAHAGRLFVVHVNDNYRGWDWDLIPGSVNWWDWIECLLYLDTVGFDDWIVSDVMPGRLDGVAVMSGVARAIKRGRRLLARVDRETLWGCIRRNDAVAAYDLFYASLGLDEE
jgi:xylose isomerase